ncbi:MAG: hypothetical protein E6222_06190 [Atopobium minutum]|nr:hypothetical protein [Atopobium minutum]MDU5357712.1 hypothetical protein [Atopobium minutum]
MIAEKIPMVAKSFTDNFFVLSINIPFIVSVKIKAMFIVKAI